MAKRHFTSTGAIAGQLAVGILTLGIIYWQFPSVATSASIVQPVFWMFAGLFVADKLGGLATAFFSDRAQDKIEGFYDALPHLLAKDRDIRAFKTRDAGYNHCIELSRTATLVKNTVLRYGARETSQKVDRVYHAWLDAKNHSVRTGICTTWIEIVSLRLKPNDSQCKLMNELRSTCGNVYEAKIIDDTTCPMVQMTIFEFGDEGRKKEILFGWEFVKAPGSSFSSQNDQLIDYFERYFDYHYENIAKPLPVEVGPRRRRLWRWNRS
jgi:hypothetical protein